MLKRSAVEPGRKAALQALYREVGVRPASEVDGERGVALRSGLAGIDGLSAGGFPRNTVCEVVEGQSSCGGAVVLHQMLRQVRASRAYAALVDGSDCFAPECVEPEVLRHLYWVRCREAGEALRVADLLAGDGNFSLLLLDLRRCDPVALRRVPGNRWYRLQRAVRKAACTCIALTAAPVIPSATLRLRLVGQMELPALELPWERVCDRVAAEPLNFGSLERFG